LKGSISWDRQSIDLYHALFANQEYSQVGVVPVEVMEFPEIGRFRIAAFS
jgi:hypothetical protein